MSFEGGLLGYPAHHSLSPKIFSFLSRECGEEIHYEAKEIPPQQFELEPLPFQQSPLIKRGWNITAPYKEKILFKLRQLSPDAQAIGAVNVLQVAGSEWVGWNTDWLSVQELLQERNEKENSEGLTSSALVYGAGGAASAAAYALGKLHIKTVWITNRHLEKADLLIQKMKALFPHTEWLALPWETILNFSQPLSGLLQMTSAEQALPSFESPSLLPFPAFGVTPQTFVLESVYRAHSWKTPFLKAFESLGGQKKWDGIDMLIAQALSSWEIWSETKFSEKRTLRQKIRTFLMQEGTLTE